jgi:N-acetylmuramic acid 6-phosphate etherase
MDLRKLATERSNPRSTNLDAMPVKKLLRTINAEDQSVPRAVAKAIPQIERAVREVVERLRSGGRLIYIGAGTSGRLGCVDASEMPPTYGVPHTLVQGIIAGGPKALLKSQEGAEDDALAGVRDLRRKNVSDRDAVIGLSASGRARYVQAALQEARARGAFAGCITCNRNSPLIAFADVAIVAETGPEVVCGSTRMKAGTAQKLILNMISTATMVQLGRVKGNRMVDLQIKCDKLRERARNLIMHETGCSATRASRALKAANGSVRDAIAMIVAA